MQVTQKVAGCDDGTCPAIWRTTDPEVVAVQGASLTDPAAAGIAGVPDAEAVVLIPRSMLAQALEDG